MTVNRERLYKTSIFISLREQRKKLYHFLTLREERDRNFPNNAILCMTRLTRFATQRSTGHNEEYLRIFSATKRIAKRVREVGSSPENNMTCYLIAYVYKADSGKHQLAPVRKVIHRYRPEKHRKKLLSI